MCVRACVRVRLAAGIVGGRMARLCTAIMRLKGMFLLISSRLLVPCHHLCAPPTPLAPRAHTHTHTHTHAHTHTPLDTHTGHVETLDGGETAPAARAHACVCVCAFVLAGGKALDGGDTAPACGGLVPANRAQRSAVLGLGLPSPHCLAQV
jgi:hypothetical protein